MKITQVEPVIVRWDRGTSAWVRITAEDGTFGIGEVSPMYGGHASLQIIHDFIPQILGRNPLEQAVLHDNLFHSGIKLGPSGALAAALAGIDIALWDLKGKLLGQPVHRLLGGAWRTSLPFYASIGGNGQRSIDEVCVEVESWLHLKPAMVKIRFDADKTARDADLAGDIAKARAVRRLVGDDIALAFDANNGYSAQGAIRVGRALEELNYTWFEEPVQSYHLNSFEKVAAALDIPVAAGEQQYTLQEVQQLIDAGVGIIQADVVKTGGITGLQRMAALTQTFGVDFVPHQTQPAIGMLASMHFVASLLHSHHPVECNEQPGRQDAVFHTPVAAVDGLFHLTDAPGLGADINVEALNSRITLWRSPAS